MLEIGSLVDGKYKILNKIGQGGMSVVYLAMNERANKQWAIKEVRKDGVSNFEVVKQGLVVETDMLKKLNHPYLPSIIDVIEEEDAFLIVMDYIEGNSLNKALKEYGALPQEDVIKWAKQLCDVLGYLHSRTPPIVYRDMKPANVMLKPDGNVTLIDFGTAREFKSKAIADTTCLGTQGYAAPEQFGGQGQTDGRTDIYCLGATIYHLVTGHNPALPPYEMYPIRQWNPLLSSGLEAIIIKCTQKNPNERYQSCAELMYALEHYQDLEIENQKKRRRRFRTFAGVLGAGILLIGSAAGVKAYANSQTRRQVAYKIEAAMGEESTQAFSDFKDALMLDPGNYEIYDSILDYMDNDACFSSEEATYIGQIKSYESSFQRQDTAKYDQYLYNLARLYYFYYGEMTGDGNVNYKPNYDTAANYYERVKASENLSEEQRTRATALHSISVGFDKLGKSSLDGESTENTYTARDYMADVTGLIASFESEDLNNDSYRVTLLKLFERANDQIQVKLDILQRGGVEYGEFQTLFSDMLSRCEEMYATEQNNVHKDTLSRIIASVGDKNDEAGKRYTYKTTDGQTLTAGISTFSQLNTSYGKNG